MYWFVVFGLWGRWFVLVSVPFVSFVFRFGYDDWCWLDIVGVRFLWLWVCTILLVLGDSVPFCFYVAGIYRVRLGPRVWTEFPGLGRTESICSWTYDADELGGWGRDSLYEACEKDWNDIWFWIWTNNFCIRLFGYGHYNKKRRPNNNNNKKKRWKFN